ncbi:unnamed protein product [Trichobilharzia regenti]|nr:unnamed protein product [Trichobilharzia regenti]
MHSAVTHGAAVATATTGKPSLITSRLWSSSFEQDQNESVSELWTRAGEAAAAKAAEAALSATPTTAINNMRRYPGAASHPMTGSSSYTMEKSVPGGSEFSTTQHLPFYSSPVVLGGSGANNAKDGLATKTNNYR